MYLKTFAINIKHFIETNLGFALHCITLAISFLLAPFLMRIDYISNFFLKYQNLTTTIYSDSIIKLFLFDLSIGLIFILVVFVNGLSLSGFILSFINTFILGAWISNYLASYYSLGLQGLNYCLIFLVPKFSIYIIAFIFSVRESFVFSKMICKAFVPGKSYNYYSDFKLYCIRFVFILLIVVLSSLVYVTSIHLIK